MTAIDILHQWTEDAIARIEASAESLGGDNPEVVEAIEDVRDPKGPDGVRAPDALHAQVFRLQALADLLEVVNEKRSSGASKPASKKDK